MRFSIATFLVFVFANFLAAAQQAGTADKGLPEDGVVRTEERWLEAFYQRDRKVLDELMPDDFMVTTPIGEVLGKSKLVPADHSVQALPKYKLVAPVTHIYGDVAVLMAKLVDESGGELSTTSVFQRNDGKWHIIAAQLSPLPK